MDIPGFAPATLGFPVYLMGAEINARDGVLRRFDIPEPVTGGLLASPVVLALYLLFAMELEFDLTARDFLLVLLFAGIGLNARLPDLIAGGKPLLLLLLIPTLLTIVAQNLIGAAGAAAFGYPAQSGVLFGLAALIGGLIARLLIERRDLSPNRPDDEHTIGVPDEPSDAAAKIDHLTVIRVLLYLNMAIIAGYALSQVILAAGLKLPLFVSCLIMGIVIGKLRPLLAPRAAPVSRTLSLALISEFALGALLAMSLMSLQLWTIADLGLSIVVIMTAQTLFAVAFVIWVLFPVMGANYRVAVLAAGFGGFALGATPTAIANMTAVTKRYGPSPIAFIVLPLVSAFFVDIANAIVIRTIVNF